MEIKEFIKTTLVQITEGVQEALDEVAKHEGSRAAINPAMEHANYTNPEKTEFDIAVTVTENKEGKANAGISVAGLNLGGGGQIASENATVSRVRFSVPVAWPSIPRDQYKADSENYDYGSSY